MSKSNYVNFINKFKKYFIKYHSRLDDTPNMVEALNSSLYEYKIKRRIVVISYFLILIFIPISVQFFFQTEAIDKATYLLVFLLILILTRFFYVFTEENYFAIAKQRLKTIESRYQYGLNWDIEDFFNAILSDDPFDEMLNQSAIDVYVELKESWSIKEKKDLIKSNLPVDEEKLYLLFILLNYGLKYKTNNEEFNRIVAAFLRINYKAMRGTTWSNLNSLKYLIEEKYSKMSNKKEEVKGILEKIKENNNLDAILSELISNTKKL